MNYTLHLAPLLSLIPLIVLTIFAVLLLGLSFYKRQKTAGLRLLACLFFALAILNPVLLKEVRQPLASIIAVVIDKSDSQNFGNRRQDTEQAVDNLKQKLAAIPNIKPRFIHAGEQNANNSQESLATRLFGPLKNSLADIPPSRIGGAVFITDGQIADIPEIDQQNSASLANKLGFKAPVNALITGNKQEYDRRIKFLKAPRFGLKGKELNLSFMVEDAGNAPTTTQTAKAEIFINGEKKTDLFVSPNKEIQLKTKLPQTGQNIIELRTPLGEKEVTGINNQTALTIDGIRENLKVLLVSGEPHNGLRTWRDLLKSDTGVDLIHFTILRPPEKQDDTPLNQLSLIVFPTKELFVDKLKDFDLVIFDRYQHYDVLPLNYYEYMARYVENGGALLIAAGPEFSGGSSLDITPLSRILPAHPTGNIFDKPFTPQPTEKGRRHPVVKNLPGSEQNPPKWGPWLRQIEARKDDDSEVLLEGANNAPLMLLAAKGKGRVGMLLSDEGWLWARGFQGGGPYAALYRRMAHWLMKEPELEEERLTAKADGQDILIERQTMQDLNQLQEEQQQSDIADVLKQKTPLNIFKVILPSGKEIDLKPQRKAAGLYVAKFKSPEAGLIRIKNGTKTSLVHVGASNMPEFEDVISTPTKIAPIAKATGGYVHRLHDKNLETVNIGNINLQNRNDKRAKAQALNFYQTKDSKLINQQQVPLFANIWALFIGLGLLALTWWQEGRD